MLLRDSSNADDDVRRVRGNSLRTVRSDRVAEFDVALHVLGREQHSAPPSSAVPSHFGRAVPPHSDPAVTVLHPGPGSTELTIVAARDIRVTDSRAGSVIELTFGECSATGYLVRETERKVASATRGPVSSAARSSSRASASSNPDDVNTTECFG